MGSIPVRVTMEKRGHQIGVLFFSCFPVGRTHTKSSGFWDRVRIIASSSLGERPRRTRQIPVPYSPHASQFPYSKDTLMVSCSSVFVCLAHSTNPLGALCAAMGFAYRPRRYIASSVGIPPSSHNRLRLRAYSPHASKFPYSKDTVKVSCFLFSCTSHTLELLRNR